MEPIFIGIIALIGGLAFGWKVGAKAVLPALRQVSNTQAIDRANFLQTLRRELANIQIWRDPQRYLKLYRELHAEISSLASCRVEEVRKRLADLCKKYPNYSDFDAIAGREYILYADSPFMPDHAELEERYRDIVIFAALSSIVDDSWKDAATKMFVHTTSEKEMSLLGEYVQRIEDTKLQLRIERAIEDYYSQRNEETMELNNDFYLIRTLPHFAENRYAIHLKRTNEFAIFSFFTFDDGGASYKFYRSGPTFEHEQSLRPLSAVLDDIRETAGFSFRFF